MKIIYFIFSIDFYICFLYGSSECGIPDYDDESNDEIETLTQTNKGKFFINLFSVKINLELNSKLY